MALALVEALQDCCHPRSARLVERLLACNQPRQLQRVHGEALNWLALSFGPAEAQHRLQALE